MKKTLLLFVALVLILGCSSALAVGDTGVQVISAPEAEAESVSLDDIKLKLNIDIDGYGTFCPDEFSYFDYIYVWKGNHLFSSLESQYALLRMDITNTTFTAKDYLGSIEVKVIFDDSYEFGGWAYQYDYDNNSSKLDHVIDDSKRFAIEPMYMGHYAFGCTLPNAVVESKKPLRMVITMDGNELTYNIRK